MVFPEKALGTKGSQNRLTCGAVMPVLKRPHVEASWALENMGIAESTHRTL